MRPRAMHENDFNGNFNVVALTRALHPLLARRTHLGAIFSFIKSRFNQARLRVDARTRVDCGKMLITW